MLESIPRADSDTASKSSKSIIYCVVEKRKSNYIMVYTANTLYSAVIRRKCGRNSLSKYLIILLNM